MPNKRDIEMSKEYGLGKNVMGTIKDNILTLVIDLSQDLGPSKSGKTHVVATTNGNVDIPEREGMKMGFNIYKYPNPSK
jgi:hypothetical protein